MIQSVYWLTCSRFVMNEEAPTIYQFRLTVAEISPLIWRRIWMRADQTWQIFITPFKLQWTGRLLTSTNFYFVASDIVCLSQVSRLFMKHLMLSWMIYACVPMNVSNIDTICMCRSVYRFVMKKLFPINPNMSIRIVCRASIPDPSNSIQVQMNTKPNAIATVKLTLA